MTPKQEEALRDYLQEVIVPLIEEVLVKKLGQAIAFAKEELPKREWQGLTAQEAADCWTTSATKTCHNFEAALRSKNT